jgi:hypothetical protein
MHFSQRCVSDIDFILTNKLLTYRYFPYTRLKNEIIYVDSVIQH